MKRRLYLIVTALILFTAHTGLCGEGVSVDAHTNTMDMRKLFNAIGATLDTRCLDSAVVSGSATPQDIAWSNAFDYAIGNRLYSVSSNAQYDLSAVAPGVSISNATCALAVFHVDNAGVVNATKGRSVTWSSNATAPYPDALPPNVCPFGAVKIVNASGQDFALGSTHFNATGVTSTFEDLSALPSLALD